MFVLLFKACVSYFVIYFPSFIYVIHWRLDIEISQYVLRTSGLQHNVKLRMVNTYSKEQATNILIFILHIDAADSSRNVDNQLRSYTIS